MGKLIVHLFVFATILFSNYWLLAKYGEKSLPKSFGDFHFRLLKQVFGKKLDGVDKNSFVFLLQNKPKSDDASYIFENYPPNSSDFAQILAILAESETELLSINQVWNFADEGEFVRKSFGKFKLNSLANDLLKVEMENWHGSLLLAVNGSEAPGVEPDVIGRLVISQLRENAIDADLASDKIRAKKMQLASIRTLVEFPSATTLKVVAELAKIKLAVQEVELGDEAEIIGGNARVPLFFTLEDKIIPSLPLLLALEYFDAKVNDLVLTAGKRVELPGHFSVKIDEHGRMKVSRSLRHAYRKLDLSEFFSKSVSERRKSKFQKLKLVGIAREDKKQKHAIHRDFFPKSLGKFFPKEILADKKSNSNISIDEVNFLSAFALINNASIGELDFYFELTAYCAFFFLFLIVFFSKKFALQGGVLLLLILWFIFVSVLFVLGKSHCSSLVPLCSIVVFYVINRKKMRKS